MFPFWHDVVAPVIEAAEGRRIVEVGALRGENTVLMLERLGPDVELHVIDPLPDFDPAEHEARFAGRYIFHLDLSVNVLHRLPPMDVALIDGDHNWYTVHTELTQLAGVARDAGSPLPVMILHDVGWPYGRRDLYYDPTNIPDEHRQPWKRAGMRPGNPGLLGGSAGMNPSLANAEVEGGPRNGVMTAVDDFVAEHDKPLRVVVLPIYFGLAIVVEEERLARQPALARMIDHLESAEGKEALLRLSEDIRLEAVTFDQALLSLRDRRIGQITDRYLGMVKSAILNDHHIELEARLHHLLTAAQKGSGLNADALRDPVRNAAGLTRLLELRHRTGEHLTLQPDAPPEQVVPDDGRTRQGYASSGRVGLDHLHRCLDDVWGAHVQGDLVSVGFEMGGAAIFMTAYAVAQEQEHRPRLRRQVWLADRFRAGPDSADLNQAREALARFDLLDDRVHFLHGDPDAALVELDDAQLAVLHLGPTVGADAEQVLERLYPKLAQRGVVIVEDADVPEVAVALGAYRSRHGITTPTERAGRSALHWVKEEPLGFPAVQPPAPLGFRAPLAARPGYFAPSLSVVVVVHNMRREAPRTLHSLSRRYQQDIDDLTYEVIVVENGSDPDQALGEELVQSYGPKFRYIDMGVDATPSPVGALNRGIEASRGQSLALMIDGAHVLTPRVLHYGTEALAVHPSSVVATQAWYVGPGQQGEVMRAGYDEAVEDALFEKVRWPDDGYRLFDIGHFAGDRDWFDGLWESNCLFVPRSLLVQVGGFDEGFTDAGGGFANLDFYERMASTPDVRITTILGEGSFHQVHGGTTTNLADPLERRNRIQSYARGFAERRGRSFMGPEKPIHVVGGFHAESAKRSRARRVTGTAFDVDPAREGIDGPAQPPAVPIPDDLRDTFVNAYHRSLAWRDTTWLGQRTSTTPTDLITYQEILHEVRPDWVIVTNVDADGRTLFVASVLDLLGEGRVVAISERDAPRPEHPRVTYLTGRPDLPDVRESVEALVGPSPKALVIVGRRGKRDRVRREFEAYAPMVPVGSYVIIEHTALNGFPIDASFGPGPHEALRTILNVHGEFLSDSEREKHGLTFNGGGFLRRIS